MKKVFEILSMVTLIIWGSVFFYFFFSGRVDSYLTETFRMWVPIAGGGMIVLGLLNLIFINRNTGACAHDHHHGDHSHCDHDHDHGHHDHDHSDCDHDHKHDETCDHGHHHHDEHDHHHEHEDATASSLAFALVVLLVPVLTAAKYSPDSFSGGYTKKWLEIEDDMRKLRQRKMAESQQIASGENPYSDPNGTGEGTEDSEGGEAWGEFTLDDLKKMVPQTSKGDFLLDVPQIYYTAGDQELMAVMEGISVETVAQVIEDTVDESSENRLRAYRLMIDCCAADARPVSIPIDFTEALPEYEEMGWYKLIGRLHFDKNDDYEYVPMLQIKSFEETPEPANWMEY